MLNYSIVFFCVDMEALSNETVGKHFSDAHVYFSCLGTTKRQAGSAVRIFYNFFLLLFSQTLCICLLHTQGTKWQTCNVMLILQMKPLLFLFICMNFFILMEYLVITLPRGGEHSAGILKSSLKRKVLDSSI